ncbi:ubiquinol-cytochrome C reductase cytochrome C subunit [Actinomycetospora sp. NBRC 106375]|uniref:cytochrome bc1 complex diheme cytochrome c subunit n=1 Tax=Actinomycetospora sp. NBRC 106375 TaxID=3032207 RepID=UPI0024A33F6C|nr:cytochrome c [Actinomycetospora sp. NBRC 106375]GLZ47417.1 ubiquinol-cytochrome C reductase cytochrome C subunit [Actinomycetospora sp. NBRC 106375]
MSDEKPRPARTRARRGSKVRRRLSGLLALGVALVAVGGLYTVLTPKPDAAQAADPAIVREGQQLYDNSCITCHGTNLQGVQGRGPSLVGVGEASVYYQVSTGRMPLAAQGAEAERKPPRYDEAQIDALGAFVQANGGGPVTPAVANGAELRGEDLGRGGELFRLNCASCHNFTGRGGALSQGKFAPVLDPASETQIYAAMLSGPSNMPTFADSQLSPEEKRDIIGYIKSVSSNNTGVNPGGNGLGGFGPVPEGLVAFFVGIAALVGISLWIGSRQ